MKAMVMRALGELALSDRPEPAPGPGEVLVRLRAASLNYRDLLVLRGGYGRLQKHENLIPLSDGAGEVAAVGASASGKVGDRVVGCLFPDWRDGPPEERKLARTLGGTVDGVAAEYRVFGAHELLPIPPGLSFAEAAALPCAALTAWNCVRAAAPEIGPGGVVLTQGTGGVSLFALQFAVAAGATVIATSSSAEKLARLRALGAAHVVNYRDDPEWGKTARKLTGGRGVDLVVEVGGGGTIKQSMRATRMGGTIALVGVVAGASQELNLPLIAMNSMRVIGVAVGSRADFAAMLAFIERHKIKPVLDRGFPLAELGAALDWLKSGRHVGKVCVEI
jgi:alcohol dehydrogenase